MNTGSLLCRAKSFQNIVLKNYDGLSEEMISEVDILLTELIDKVHEQEKRLQEIDGIEENIISQFNRLVKVKNGISLSVYDYVKVQLTNEGEALLRYNYDRANYLANGSIGSYIQYKKHKDKNGYTEFQLGEFMTLFGPHIGMRKKRLFDQTIIIDGR